MSAFLSCVHISLCSDIHITSLTNRLTHLHVSFRFIWIRTIVVAAAAMACDAIGALGQKKKES